MSIITKVSVYTLNDTNSKTVALATVTISDCLVLTGLRIVKGKKGMFVYMPQRKLTKPDKNGNEYADIFFPVTNDFREKLNNAILDEYDKKIDEEKNVRLFRRPDDFIPF